MVRRIAERVLRGERGQGLVEFVLVLPLLLIVLFAIVDFGRAYSTYVTLNNAAREGARYGAVGKSSAEIISRVQEVAADLDAGAMNVVVTNAQGLKGTTVSVSITYDFDLITPLDAMVGLAGGVTLSADSSMRLE